MFEDYLDFEPMDQDAYDEWNEEYGDAYDNSSGANEKLISQQSA